MPPQGPNQQIPIQQQPQPGMVPGQPPQGMTQVQGPMGQPGMPVGAVLQQVRPQQPQMQPQQVPFYNHYFKNKTGFMNVSFINRVNFLLEPSQCNKGQC